LGKQICKTSNFYGWYLVSTSLQIFKTKASFTFIVWEKHFESKIQYFKDRTESFDDYFPCM